MKILLTGGSGLLGRELQKYITCDAPPHSVLDITKPETLTGSYDLVIHAAAYTDVVKAETDYARCFEVNVTGTLNVSLAYRKTPFVLISSEYALKPVNVYSFSKKFAEEVLRLDLPSRPNLIIRTLFKPSPFPWDRAFYDQHTQGDYVDVIAPLIAEEIKRWSKETSYTVYIGTGRKTMLDLAKRTRPDVKPCSVYDIADVLLPTDYL